MTRLRAVVTGGGSRTGAAVATELARHGFDLVLTCRHGRAGAEAVAEEVRQHGAVVEVHDLDLEDASAIKAFAKAIGPGAVDALVHVAGSFEEGRFEDIDDAMFQRHYRANASGPALLTQALEERLRSSAQPDGACVLFFGDIHAEQSPRPGATAYLVSKAATHALVRLLAIELAPVRVVGVAPGVIGWPDDWTEDQRSAYLRRVPLGRAGTPSDAAKLVKGLIQNATYLTGVMLPLDGGRHLR